MSRFFRAAAAASSKILRFFGKYSYALYVFHAGVMLVLIRAGIQATSFVQIQGSQLIGQLAFTTMAIVLATLLAVLSWHLLEAPALSLKQYVGRAPASAAIKASVN